LPPVTIGDDHPRPGISCDHSTFSVLDQRSASRACVPTGFDCGPRNCGHAMSCACTGVENIANSTSKELITIRLRCDLGEDVRIIFWISILIYGDGFRRPWVLRTREKLVSKICPQITQIAQNIFQPSVQSVDGSIAVRVR